VHSQLLIVLPSRFGLLRLGELLDVEGRAQLRRTLDEARGSGCSRLVVDCSRVQHIDQATLADLCAAASDLAARGGRFRVRSPSWAFTRIAEQWGCADLLRAGHDPELGLRRDGWRPSRRPVVVPFSRRTGRSSPRGAEPGRHRLRAHRVAAPQHLTAYPARPPDPA
jgi:anti-anti-sigma regulatory factor